MSQNLVMCDYKSFGQGKSFRESMVTLFFRPEEKEEDLIEHIETVFFNRKNFPNFDFGAIGLEIAEGGRRHLQMYFHLKSPMKVKKAAQMIRPECPERIHWDFPIVIRKTAFLYPGMPPGTALAEGKVKKGQVEWRRVYGTPPKVFGVRQHRLLTIQSMIDSGASISEVAQIEFVTWCPNYRSIQLYHDELSPISIHNRLTQREDPAVLFLSGPTKVGKSGIAQTFCSWVCGGNPQPGEICKMTVGTRYWFNSMQKNCKVLWFDEFRSGMQLGPLLQLLLGGQCELSGYGKMIPVPPSLVAVVFTSNIAAKDQYPKVDEPTKEAFLRRLTWNFEVAQSCFRALCSYKPQWDWSSADQAWEFLNRHSKREVIVAPVYLSEQFNAGVAFGQTHYNHRRTFVIHPPRRRKRRRSI